MKSVCITGATSFLGVRTVARLKLEGLAVTLIVRRDSDLTRFDDQDVTHAVYTYDGTTGSLVAALAAARPDACFHIAGAYVREHLPEDVDRLIESNVRFGAQLLEAMKESGPAYLVNVGSAFQHYHSDDYAPLNFYAATKQAFADILAYYESAHGIVSATIKLPDVYGSGDWRPKIMNRIVEAHMNGAPLDLVDKSTVLGLVHVDDACDALMHCARLLMDDAQSVAGKSFAVDGRNQHSLAEIVSTVRDVTGRSVDLNWGAYATPPRHVVVPWSGTPLPNWDPKIDLEEGVRRLAHSIEAPSS